MTKVSLSELVDLALEVEKEDPIDFGMLSINEKTAFTIMASYVLELDNDDLVNRAVITKLLVENMVLNLQLTAARQ